MLNLEFHFVCCLRVSRIRSIEVWEERVTPFHEWREYLTFLKATTTPSIKVDVAKIQRFRSS
jgi:uncharacterized protein involved in tolerance to divalent cations